MHEMRWISFSFLILLIWFFLFFLMSLAKGLSLLFIFSKNQLLVLLIFTVVSFISFSLISAWMFMISFLLLLLGFSFHPNAEAYTFFSRAHGTFSGIDHSLGCQSNLSKFNETEIISSIFSNHNAMRLDTNYKKKKNCKKHRNMEIKQHISK